MFKFIYSIFTISWRELLNWFHSRQNSLWSYIGKVLIGILIYVMVNDALDKFIAKVLTDQTEEEVHFSDVKEKGYSLTVYFMLKFIKAFFMIGLLYELMSYIKVIETDPMTTIAISSGIVLLLVIQGAFAKWAKKVIKFFHQVLKGEDIEIKDPKQINIPKLSRHSSLGNFFITLFRVVFKIAAFAIAIIIVILVNRGISYVLESKGVEVARLLRKNEYELAKETKTSFFLDEEAVGQLPIYLGEDVTVKSNGELNIIFINGTRVGINTSGRKYKFYGVAVNQTEISIKSHMYYHVDNVYKVETNTSSLFSDSYLYVNKRKNDCILVTVNNTSHRVASITYFYDYFKMAQKMKMIE